MISGTSEDEPGDTQPPLLNVMSVDVEDYFQVEAFASVVPLSTWNQYELRVERNVLRILELFAKRGVVATFFVLGWIAEKCPRLVDEIARAGHEIGSHGYAHKSLLRSTPAEFRQDIKRATSILSDQLQQPIVAYRAPSFSILKSTSWALDVLAEEGMEMDSSMFPVQHDLYGIPDGERFPHWLKTDQARAIFEFPPSTMRVMGRNVGVGGGGYLRLFPYVVTRKALRRINEVDRQPAMIYFHPWEIDPLQPRIHGGLRSKLRHYTNLTLMEGKLDALLTNFQFASLSQVCADLRIYCEAAASQGGSTETKASASR